ncbi:calcium/proton exchanger [Clostridium sp. SYSU_GA19001]|uniref:calcium/proton exchanger n=1 Tax=Clostridium caldaquaticum TaxID=2940653 RepID=UPI0020778FBA|nr:calcium/proton exchanger [Clostridium caldaquaticum]MCM8711098.1 calcium/proton exchanger [Clostridium caldaquaticum]
MKKIYIFTIVAFLLTFIKSSSDIINVIICSTAVIPVAILLGDFTSDISEYIGEKKGGLLAATLGNLPELMMGIWSIQYGMLPMVKSALIGSIIGNMLLVLGISIFFGGIKYKDQKFNKMAARTNFNMLLLAMSAIIVIASINKYGMLTKVILTSISVKVAVVLITVYMLGLVFSMYTHCNLFVISDEKEEMKNTSLHDIKIIIAGICLSSILLYIISEKLIYNIKSIVNTHNISQEFLGIMLIPILGNVGENISAIMSALKNKINLSLEIAIGSSIQISLFVAPLLILFAYFTTAPMTLIFSTFQIIICLIAVGMSYFVFQDGKTYWLEGAILIAIYIMIALGYYYVA